MLGLMALAGFIATIPAANWLIGHVGECIPGGQGAPPGPCVIPVGFGLSAPSGVLVIGLALVLRDVVHHRLGAGVAFVAIVIGAGLSASVAPGALVVASATAFLLSEMADFWVYAPLYRRQLVGALVLSGLAGAIVDSAVFLFLAFGSLDFLAGQVVGKLWATLAAAALVLAMRERV
jgi:hypothetical protein